ncbi:unnamed protein product [Ambrosiozyma monospora]|uniref:Unnamed protein product n=1 Tax=Ambrosiozyma monospora TaxID=43982 RepID=A0ACB5SR65_AMBMO|nr:unnamed protein product [Ambrosiozyma monospora]
MDRDKSMEGVTMIFYWAINIGAFFSLATTYSARNVGYYLAFLAPGLMYLIVCVVMVIIGSKIDHLPPQGSILGNVCKVLSVCFRGNFIKRIRRKEFWDFAYPTNMQNRGETYYKTKKQKPITWVDQDVKNFHATFLQCGMFLYWVIFNLSDSGLGSALNAQAGAMTTKNVPNDLFSNFNPLVIIVLIPLLEKVIYPTFERLGIEVKSVHKISFGFFLGSMTSMTAALIQWRIYETSPCGYHATTCDDVSPISAWVEVSVYALAAAGECFCMTQAYELSYTRAPENSKSLVTALFLLTNSFSAAIEEAITGALVDPHLIWPFTALACIGFVSTVVFLIQYWNLDKVMAQEALDREHAKQEKLLREQQQGNELTDQLGVDSVSVSTNNYDNLGRRI